MNETVNVEAWALTLIDNAKQTPIFYYNRVNDTFKRSFSNQCAFLSRVDAEKAKRELNIEGLELVYGTIPVGKEFLINVIMSVFVENGLAKEDEQ